jgi:hypothetical protein
VQPLIKRIEQLEEKVRVMGSMKSMGHWDPIRPSAARKPAAAASRPQVIFVSPPDGHFAKDSGIERGLRATTDTACSQWTAESWPTISLQIQF